MRLADAAPTRTAVIGLPLAEVPILSVEAACAAVARKDGWQAERNHEGHRGDPNRKRDSVPSPAPR